MKKVDLIRIKKRIPSQKERLEMTDVLEYERKCEEITRKVENFDIKLILKSEFNKFKEEFDEFCTNGMQLKNNMLEFLENEENIEKQENETIYNILLLTHLLSDISERIKDMFYQNFNVRLKNNNEKIMITQKDLIVLFYISDEIGVYNTIYDEVTEYFSEYIEKSPDLSEKFLDICKNLSRLMGNDLKNIIYDTAGVLYRIFSENGYMTKVNI